jgi:asparagine synthase (glutamine-hydrolysing)
MFALAVWDDRRRALVLAVDRFGIKPLYYAQTPTGIVFGSELRCVLRSGFVAREPDLDAVAEFFTYGYVPAPRTAIAGVSKLGPGQVLRWQPGGEAEVTTYWAVPVSAQRRPEDGSSAADVRDALRESVKAHLVSDVPLGAFLSGGIDSSTVVALMSEVTAEPVKTFSIGFADPRYDERPKARLVAEKFGTDHHELVVEPEDVDLLPRIVSHFGEPFADASALPTYHVSRLAREHVKVALSGDGGDELFLGYSLFRGLRVADAASHLPKPLRSAAVAATRAIPRLPSSRWNDGAARLRKVAGDSLREPDDAYRRKLTAPGVAAVSAYLEPSIARELLARRPYDSVDAALAAAADGTTPHGALERFVRAGFLFSLPNDMLVKVDRMSMAHSLEVRVPLLDDVLVAHVSRIPIRDRFHRWRLKGVLKDAMRGVLPEEILAGPKRGFVVPLAAWFRGDLGSYAREVLGGSDVVSGAAADALLARHRGGQGNLGSVIWSLLVFQLWWRDTVGAG